MNPMGAERIARVAPALVLAALATLTGCVVDRERTESLRETRAAAPPTLPRDPVAQPVLGGTTASRVSVAVESLGMIDYDGLTVPMVSPDGQFLATQTAPTPQTHWRLALDGPPPERGQPMPTVSISLLRANIAGPARGVEAFDQQAPILLGRDANREGTLIESPRPDGSRWIGIAQWHEADARIRWLVRGRAVSAHAVLAENNGLLYCRRPANDPGARFVLVHRDGAGLERTLEMPDAHLVYPLLAPDMRHATCLAVDDNGAISMLLIDLSTASMGSLGRVVRRYDLASAGGLQGAAQIVAASQSAVHGLSQRDAMAAAATTDPMPSLGPIVFHPAMDRAVAIDASRRAQVALAPNSVAAVDAGDGRALCSTPDGLVLWTPGPQAGRGTATRVLSEDYLPRRTANPDRPFVLFAPMRRSPTSLMVFGLAPQ